VSTSKWNGNRRDKLDQERREVKEKVKDKYDK